MNAFSREFRPPQESSGREGGFDANRRKHLRERIHPEGLPVFEEREAIARLISEAISSDGKMLLQGETGSGKSVLLPGIVHKQLIATERNPRILSIQPRRDAAFMVSQAISAVQDFSWGNGGVVGCSTSETKEVDANTEISVVTTGIAVRYLSEMVRDVLEGRAPKSDFGAAIVLLSQALYTHRLNSW